MAVGGGPGEFPIAFVMERHMVIPNPKALGGDDPYVEADIARWLCALARAENDLSPYLDRWLANDSHAAKANLERFVTDHRSKLANAFAPGGYWDGIPTQWDQVVHWLKFSVLFSSRD